MTPVRALLRHHACLLRRSTVVLAALFFAAATAVTNGYEGLYPEGVDRSSAVELGANPGFRALFGSGAGFDTAGGFTAWRLGGPGVVVLAVWGYLATTRLLRGEEDAGRTELVRAGAVTATAVVGSVAAAVSVAAVVLAAGVAGGMVAGGVPLDGAVLTAASVMTGGIVFGAVGVVAAELLPTRRAAALASGGVVAGAFLVRAVANVRDGLGWLRWGTPLGWAELTRPFGDRTVLPLVVSAAVTVVLALGATALARRRDLGAAFVADAPTRKPRPTGLRTSFGLTARHGIPRAVVWLVPVVIMSATFGFLSKDVAEFFATNETFQEVFERFGVDPDLPVRAFLGFVASTFAIAGVCFAVAEVTAAREEEASGRLDNVLVRAVTRRSWLLGRMAVALAGVVILAVGLAAGSGTGASWAGAGIAIGDFVDVGINALPVAVFFLGLTGLVFAVAPRRTSSLGFGLVGVGFLWQILGSSINAPQWSLDLTPFAHVAPVPAQGVNVGAAVALVVIGLVCTVGAVEIFARRDLQDG